MSLIYLYAKSTQTQALAGIQKETKDLKVQYHIGKIQLEHRIIAHNQTVLKY